MDSGYAQMNEQVLIVNKHPKVVNKHPKVANEIQNMISKKKTH